MATIRSWGGSSQDFLNGGPGNDLITAGKGYENTVDTLIVEAGNDTIDMPAIYTWQHVPTHKYVPAYDQWYYDKIHITGPGAIAYGGYGDDVYYHYGVRSYSSPRDKVIVEFADQGYDIVHVDPLADIVAQLYFVEEIHLGCSSLSREIYGTWQAQAFYGLHRGDTLYAGEGDDTLYTRVDVDLRKENAEFEHVIATYDGNSENSNLNFQNLGWRFVRGEPWTVHGSERGDDIVGGGSLDKLYGYGGDDSLVGAGLNDYLSGGEGNDSLYGGVDNDTLYGDAGDDYLESGAGHDEVYGGTGDDTLIGSDGNDTLAGGDGDDFYRDVSLGSVIIEDALGGDDTQIITQGATRQGENVERLIYERSYVLGVEVRQDLYVEGNSVGNSLKTGIGDDTLRGMAGDDTLMGGSGADLYEGGAGRDFIEDRGTRTVTDADTGMQVASGLDDTLDGGLGADFMRGGLGSDLYIVDNAGDVALDSAEDAGAEDTVWFHASEGDLTYNASVMNMREVETLRIDLSAAGQVSLSTDARADHIIGNAASDTIDGGFGNDLNLGGRGTLGRDGQSLSDVLGEEVAGDDARTHDVLKGGAGDDTIFASVGDSVDGGAGQDELFVNAAVGPDQITNVERTVFLEADTELFVGGTGTTVITQNDSFVQGNAFALTGQGVQLLAQGGDDSVTGTGSVFVDLGTGNDSDTHLLGTGGTTRTVIVGGEGGDTVTLPVDYEVLWITEATATETVTRWDADSQSWIVAEYDLPVLQMVGQAEVAPGQIVDYTFAVHGVEHIELNYQGVQVSATPVELLPVAPEELTPDSFTATHATIEAALLGDPAALGYGTGAQLVRYVISLDTSVGVPVFSVMTTDNNVPFDGEPMYRFVDAPDGTPALAGLTNLSAAEATALFSFVTDGDGTTRPGTLTLNSLPEAGSDLIQDLSTTDNPEDPPASVGVIWVEAYDITGRSTGAYPLEVNFAQIPGQWIAHTSDDRVTDLSQSPASRDTIIGGVWNDTILSGDGGDEIYGGGSDHSGTEQIDAGWGNDFVQVISNGLTYHFDINYEIVPWDAGSTPT